MDETETRIHPDALNDIIEVAVIEHIDDEEGTTSVTRLKLPVKHFYRERTTELALTRFMEFADDAIHSQTTDLDITEDTIHDTLLRILPHADRFIRSEFRARRGY